MLRNASRSIPPSPSSARSISALDVTGQERPARATATSLSLDVPAAVAEPPIAAEGDPLESRTRGAAHGRQLDIGERELHVAADESRALPVEIDRHVPVAGLRHDGGIRHEAADRG